MIQIKLNEYQQFIEWMATPPRLRVVKDQRQLATQLGVHESTLSDWKRTEGFWQSVNKLTNEWGRSRTVDVLNAFYKKVVANPTAGNVKLWLEYFEDFKPNKKVTIEDDNARQQTEILDEILDKLMVEDSTPNS